MAVESPVWELLDPNFPSKLQQLDLRPIQKQLIQSGWTHQQAMRAINRYKMFLSVVSLHPHTALVPTQEIDFVWHCHILHTRKYRQDCQMLFERFIDHEPDRELLQYSLDTAFAQTQALLVQYFGDAALGDASLEQPDSLLIAENWPQQQKFSENGDSYLHHSACGRPTSCLLETSYLTQAADCPIL